MQQYFFVNHTIKEICRFDRTKHVLQQLEMTIAASMNWHIRQHIIVEADPSSVYRLVDNHDYVFLR
jgi:hypothetical protein